MAEVQGNGLLFGWGEDVKFVSLLIETRNPTLSLFTRARPHTREPTGISRIALLTPP